MRYMCLVHFEPNIMINAPLAEQQDLDRRSLAYDEELKRTGHYVSSQAIQGPESAPDPDCAKFPAIPKM